MYAISKELLSCFHKAAKPIIYARKGEPVTLIADRGNVWIMEDRNGNRFPVNKNHIVNLSKINVKQWEERTKKI